MPSPAGTVSIVAAISLVVQCVIWLASFILYVLTYECVFTPTNTTAVDLGDRIIYYMQGDSCSGKSVLGCYNGELFSPKILLGILSAGAAYNFILLIICFVLLAGFWSHPVAKRSVMVSFILSIFLVSAWDFVLTGIVATDYNNLPHFCPGDALITVFMAACRGGFLLAANIAFATYLLISLCSEPSSKGKTANSKENTLKRQPLDWTAGNSGGNWQFRNGTGGMPEMQQQPPPHTAAARFSTPPPSVQHESIHSRWAEYRGSPEEDDWSPSTSISRHTNMGQDLNYSREQDFVQEQRNDELIVPPKAEWRIALERRESDRRQKNFQMPQQQFVMPHLREVSQNPSTKHTDITEQQSSKDAAWEEDLSRTLAAFDDLDEEPRHFNMPQRQTGQYQRPESRNSNTTSVSSHQINSEQSSRPASSQNAGPKLPADAFTYGYGGTFFGVRLKHVKRDEPADSTNSNDEESREDIKPNPTPNNVQPAESSPKSDNSEFRPASSSKPPPKSPEPPPQPMMKMPAGPSTSKPISLQEAILTRRPLKPVNRPHIDTTK